MRITYLPASLYALLLAGDPAAAQSAAPAQPSQPSAAAPAPMPATPLITPAELAARIDRGDNDMVVLDVRTPEEFAAGHVPGARNVSHDQVTARIDELMPLRDKQVVVYCRSGRRSALAEQDLRNAGFERLLHLKGDYLEWEAEKLPTERAP